MAPPTIGGAIPYQRAGLVPVAIEVRPGIAPVKATVEVPVKMARPEHRVGMAHADRLETVPEATSLGRLHERNTGDRSRHNCPKNKPHEVTSIGCTSPNNTTTGSKNLTRSDDGSNSALGLLLSAIVENKPIGRVLRGDNLAG